MGDEVRAEHLELKQFLRERVSPLPRATHDHQGRPGAPGTVRRAAEGRGAAPDEHRLAAQRAEARDGMNGRARVVADYVAGMTDRYMRC